MNVVCLLDSACARWKSQWVANRGDLAWAAVAHYTTVISQVDLVILTVRAHDLLEDELGRNPAD